MAYPPAYVRAYSFTDFETLNPGEPKPGDKLDTEYDAVANALTATQTNLALIQRADGALANESVGADQLQPGLFDGIGDAAAADAEAAAAAAAASAGAAASSASAAAASAAAAATDAGVASGAASAAGVSQSIAQGAATDATDQALAADVSADVAVAAANSVINSVSEAQLHEELAFKWAEYLAAPVAPAPPGWPEAVDDGMFSAKWWALRARDYNSTDTIDLGTAGADVGEAFDIWDAIPGNDLGIGLTYATWGSPTQTYVLVDRSDPSDPASWVNITGGPGPAGPPNTLTVGTVNTGAPGSAALVSITGTSPNQVLNMQIPAGATGGVGPAGPAGPPNALAIGTVTTVPDGTPSSATITGTAPTQTLNLTLTAGPQGIQGIQGIQGPVGPAVNVANPTGVIGLTAVNGVATTAPRSDSSPALSQAIAPTWTATHTFTPASGRAITANGVANQYTAVLLGSGTSGQSYGLGVRAGSTAADTAMDVLSQSGTRNFLSILGNGGTTFGNTTDNPTYSFLGTGLTTHNGPLLLTGGTPEMRFDESDQASGSRLWRDAVAAQIRTFQIADDAGGTLRNWLAVYRSGAAVSALEFGNATNNPTYTFLGSGAGTVTGPWTFFSPGGSVCPVNIVGGSAEWSLKVTNSTAIPYGALITAGDSSAASLYVRRGDSGNRDLFIVQGNAFTFGNTTDNPAYNFNGTGVATFGGAVTINSGAAPNTLNINSTNATGNYLRLLRNGTPYAFVGNGAALINSGVLDALAFRTESLPIVFTTNSGLSEAARFTQNGSLQITGAYSGGTGAALAPSLEISMGSATVASLLAYNRGTSTYLALQLNCASCEISGPGNAQLRMLGKDAIRDNADGYLRLNNSGDYGSGVYSSLDIRSNTWLVSEFGLRDAASANVMRPNHGAQSYGSFWVQGVTGGYHGLTVDDGGLRPVFMSNNATAGIYMNGDANWLLFRSTSVLAVSQYTVQAVGFTTTSSRALKRETGTPSRPANILARLRPLLYRLLDGDDREQLGLIAEEVHDVCPQLSDGKTVAYDRLAILLLAAWQDEHLEAA